MSPRNILDHYSLSQSSGRKLLAFYIKNLMQILPFYHLFYKPGWQPNEYKSIDASAQRSRTGSLKTPHHSTEKEIVQSGREFGDSW